MLAISIVLFVVPDNSYLVMFQHYFTYRISLFRNQNLNIQGKYNEYLKKLGKYDLMILDEFLLKSTSESERSDLLELMEIRCNKKSTIFCSQYSFDGWHQLLNGGPIADAILDRIINSSYLITLHGKSLKDKK